LEISPALDFLAQTHWEIALALINTFCDFHANFLGTLTILTLLTRLTDFPVPSSVFSQAFIARLLTDPTLHERIATGAFLTLHPLSLLICHPEKIYSHRRDLQSWLIDLTVFISFPLHTNFPTRDIAVHFLRAPLNPNTISPADLPPATLLTNPTGDRPPSTTFPTAYLASFSLLIKQTMGQQPGRCPASPPPISPNAAEPILTTHLTGRAGPTEPPAVLCAHVVLRIPKECFLAFGAASFGIARPCVKDSAICMQRGWLAVGLVF
jgi:hypothetical protein